jgi:hypothetical protein
MNSDISSRPQSPSPQRSYAASSPLPYGKGEIPAKLVDMWVQDTHISANFATYPRPLGGGAGVGGLDEFPYCDSTLLSVKI